MPTEFERVLEQAENTLSSGQKLRPDKHFIGQPLTIGQFSYQPLVLIEETNRYYPLVEVRSPVGSILQIKDADRFYASFAKLVTSAVGRDYLNDYQIMGFFAPTGEFLDPRRAVDHAETGGSSGAQSGAGGGGELSPTPPGLKNGIWTTFRPAPSFPFTTINIDIASGRRKILRIFRACRGMPATTKPPTALPKQKPPTVPVTGAPPTSAAEARDAPILALGNNLRRALAVSANTNVWYEGYPPPAAPKNPAMTNAYVRALRSYLKKMSIQLIERDQWFLLWRGFLYTNGRGMNFAQVLAHSLYLKNPNFINWPPEVTITELTLNNASSELNRHKWRDLITSNNTRMSGRGMGGNRAYTTFYDHFRNLGDYLRRKYPVLFPRHGVTEDIELTGDLLHALVEARLDESLTYNQMLTATAQYWQTRLKTVRNVHTKPPGLVMLKDGTVDLSFDFVSVPSTEGRPHQGYVKFVPERGQPNLIDKLKDFLGRIGQQVKKFIGKKVPPRALKGSDLRKMLCEVSCDCKDFRYRMSYANVKQGVTTQAGRTDNGRAPVKTNPARRPGFCKHILATLRYLTDDAEIQISKDLSAQQQEALKKDRAQFYKEAQVSYEKMKAPAAKGAEKIEPEEEPPSPEFAKLPAPPKPELAPKPLVPPPAAPPPTPNYQSNQV